MKLRLADAEVGQRNAVGVQHPVDVVVRGDQQRRRVAERGVVGQPLRGHVPVRGDDRQVLDTLIELARCRTEPGLSRQQSIRIKAEGRDGGHDTILVKTTPDANRCR